ncbi:hypothetical protein M9458_029874, partial [Cirrhinus mrigala]
FSRAPPHPQPRTRSRTQAAARSQTPSTAPCSSRPSAALPRSNRLAAVPRSELIVDNMASHLYNKDTMDQFELLSPSLLLVPYSLPPDPPWPPELCTRP